MSTTTVRHDGLAKLAEEVARSLAKAGTLDGRAYIRTPVLLPSGASVVVVLEAEDEAGHSYRLSDLRQGYEEALQLGCALLYRRRAAEAAARSGLAFLGDALVLGGVDRGQLVAATAVLANAVSAAVEHARLSAPDRQRNRATKRFVTRLGGLFNPAHVRVGEEIRGASTHAWRVDALVETEYGLAVFDLVAAHISSVGVANAKFHDLARLDRPPARVAVVRSKRDLGDLLTVLSQSARVVEQDAPDPALRRAAQAA